MTRAGAWRTIRFALIVALCGAFYYLLESWLLDVHEAAGHLIWPSRGSLALPLWLLGWVPLAPLIVRSFERHPVDRHIRAAVVGRYLLLGLCYSFTRGILVVPLWLMAIGAPGTQPYGPFTWLIRIIWWTILRTPSGLLEFLFVATAYHALALARQAREGELVATQLREELARAELDTLRMRLEPHFLFNTLNSITSFIETDPALAQRMVGQLSRLLRNVLELHDATEVPLEQELALVRDYLDIVRLRFGDRLEVSVETGAADPGAMVPVMLLQPLVENAVQHGIASQPGPGRLSIHAARQNGVLEISVTDEHLGENIRTTTQGSHSGRGVGLSTTNARLRQLYGERATLTLDVHRLGSTARLTLPFRTASG